MKKIFYLTGLVHLLLTLSSCSTPFPALLGFTSQHVHNLSSQSPNVTSNKILRSGESCSFSSIVLITAFYYGSGNSVEQAKQNGKITKIAVVDRSSMSILGPIFYKECTIVWGE
jgi:hypothetical protein